MGVNNDSFDPSLLIEDRAHLESGVLIRKFNTTKSPSDPKGKSRTMRTKTTIKKTHDTHDHDMRTFIQITRYTVHTTR